MLKLTLEGFFFVFVFAFLICRHDSTFLLLSYLNSNQLLYTILEADFLYTSSHCVSVSVTRWSPTQFNPFEGIKFSFPVCFAAGAFI